MKRSFTTIMVLRIVISISLALIGSELSAQPVSRPTLEQCLSLAKQNSLKLQIAERELKIASLSGSELQASGRPQISAKAGAGYAPHSKNFGYDPAITDGGQLNGQLAVEQSLYDGGVRRLKRAQLSIELDKLRAERQIAEHDLIADVTRRYIEVLRSARAFELQQESVNQLQNYYDLVRSMNQGGAAGMGDVLRTQVDLSSARVALENVHNARLNASLALELATGLPSDTNLTVMGSLDTVLVNYGDTLTVAAVGFPLHSAELQRAKFDVQGSELEVAIARGEHRPMIDLTADTGYLSSRDNLAVPAHERYDGIGFSAGLNATLSLFNGGATRLRMQQAQLATESLRFQQQLLERALNNQVQSLALQIRSTVQTLKTLRQNIETAERNYLLVRSTYAGGGTTATEVLTAQQLLRDAKVAELEAVANILQLRTQLAQTTAAYTGTHL
jgi:OMF family outer membrane factor